MCSTAKCLYIALLEYHCDQVKAALNISKQCCPALLVA